jgi:hypothetical protein
MEEKRPTMPVPAAGRKYYGLGRNASYAAAKRGDIPTITIGGRIFAVVPAIERQLGLLGDEQIPGSLSDGAQKSARPPAEFAHRQRENSQEAADHRAVRIRGSGQDAGEKTSAIAKSRPSSPK